MSKTVLSARRRKPAPRAKPSGTKRRAAAGITRARSAARPKRRRIPHHGIPAHLHPQAGAVPYRIGDEGEIQVLMVTNTAGGWIVPKGTIDPGWTAPETAMNEALEEAGVVSGVLGPELGHYEYHKGTRHCRVRIFALRVKRLQESWLEEDERKRQWVSLKQAVKKAAFEDLSAIIAKLEKALG